MMQYPKISFRDIKDKVPAKPGIYEIYTKEGVALKVGIGVNLQKRLLQHLASKQKYLVLKPSGNWSNPADVVSKRSILAKHLYFETLFGNYDLKTELGRRKFLEDECYIRFQVTAHRQEARTLEKIKEAEGNFRYIGKPNISKAS